MPVEKEKQEVRAKPRIGLIAAAALVFLLALSLRVYFGRLAVGPLDNDSTYYYLLGRNLAEGRGFVEDLVWNYVSPPASVTHPSHDYWMPLESLLIAGSLRLGGGAFFTALLPNLFFGSLLPVLAMALALQLGARKSWALAAGLFLACSPRLVFYSITTDAAVVYAFFGGLAAWTALQGGKGKPAWLLASGAAIGLCHLSRNDGALWAPALIVLYLSGLRRPADGRPALRGYLFAAAGYLIVMAPWMLRNLSAFGALFPPASTRVMFFHDYMDMYAFGREFNWHTYWAGGVAGPLQAKISALGEMLKTEAVRGPLDRRLAPFALLGLLRARPRARVLFVSHAALVALVWSFLLDALVGPYGGTERTAVGQAIYLVPAAMLGFQQLDDWLQALLSHRRAWAPALLLAVAAFLQWQSPLEWNRLDRVLKFARSDWAYFQKVGLALKSGDEARPVVMAFRPWQLAAASGLPAVSIPSNGWAATLAACRRYGVDDLVLETDRKFEKPEFQEVVANLEAARQGAEAGVPAGPFQPAGRVGDSWIFKLVSPETLPESEAPP